MSGRITNRSAQWWSWPMVGLFLTLAFLSHDLLMTGDAHHVHAAHDHARHGADGAMDGVRRPIGPVTGDALTARSRETLDVGWSLDGCGYDRTAVLTAADGSLLAFDYSLVAWSQLEHLQRNVHSTTAEPTAPPGVRRALLQVFLI